MASLTESRFAVWLGAMGTSEMLRKAAAEGQHE